MKFFTDENIKERNNIAKRLIFLFAVFICLFSAAILSLFLASQNADAQNVVDQQSSYLLSVYKSRGTIYDKDLEPITNAHEKYAYAVAPCANSMYEISNIYGDKYLPQLKNAAPFLFFDDKLSLFSNDYIDTFVVNERYSDVAPHVVGYLDFNKTGVYGIERAFEGILSRFKGEAKIKYTVNAKNTAIAIDEREITDTLSASKGGVVLTIEKELQLFCQKAAEKYIKTGAIVVSEVNTGKLRAVVSVPGYSQNALENSL